MSISNANYLQDPTKLSTRVHHAPGGGSSLSLGWEEPNKKQNMVKKNQYAENSLTPKMQQSYNISQINESYENYPHYTDKQISSKPYFQPSKNYMNLKQQNSILEEELKYYQLKNRQLRQNLFSGMGDLQKIINSEKEYTNIPISDHHRNNHSQYYKKPSYNQPEEIDMAVYHQSQRRQSERQMYSPQQRLSKKVYNPPGGRSSIVFG